MNVHDLYEDVCELLCGVIPHTPDGRGGIPEFASPAEKFAHRG